MVATVLKIEGIIWRGKKNRSDIMSSRGSVTDMVPEWTIRCLNSGRGNESYVFCKMFIPDLEPIQASIQLVPGYCPRMPGFKNMWSCISAPLMCLHVMHRDTFTFTFTRRRRSPPGRSNSSTSLPGCRIGQASFPSSSSLLLKYLSYFRPAFSRRMMG